MPERFTDQQLEAVLASVGRHLVVPTGVATVTVLPSRTPTRRPASTLVLAAAAVVAVLLVVGAAVTPVREAVADWLGIGSTQIERVDEDAGDARGLPLLSAGAVPATTAEARAQLGQSVPVVADRTFGKPARVAIPPEGGVLLAWPREASTLWVHRDDGSGVTFVKKLLDGVDRATWIDGLGAGAALIEGKHVLETPARRVAAGRVLIWVEDGLEYRLESELPRHRMLEVARSVSASGP